MAIVIAAEVVLGVIVYCSPRRVDLALGIACGGVAAFAVIDRWPRPHTGPEGAAKLRWFLPVWSLVPFACALACSAWVHFQQWRNGLDDFRDIAAELDGKSLDRVIAERFPYAPADPREQRHFIELAQVVAHDRDLAKIKLDRLRSHKDKPDQDEPTGPRFTGDRFTEGNPIEDKPAEACASVLEKPHGNVKFVRCRARRDSMLDFVLTLGAQAVFVLWIPGLLMISMARARRNLDTHADSRLGDNCRAAAAPMSLHDCIAYRDLRILAEDRSYFIPRLCFGALLVLGTTYMFAPFGLKESYLMSLANDHALPGHTSFVLWCNNFAEVPVIVVGFVGFLVYALITATQRFAQDDLDDLSIMALLVRGLIVILLSLALSASPINNEAARLFVFIAGVFPVRALEAIAKRANVSIDPDFASDGPSSFEGIPNLDPAKVFALRAAGIQSSYDLAAMRIEDVARRVRIDPRLLGRAVDRAILIDAVGRKLAEQLEPFAITSATELVDARPLPEAVTDRLGDAPGRAAQRLADDGRVVQVRHWLVDAQREQHS
ncbi:MAG TPA: hypothetical protein VK607_05780 [Kofleriaceae bacterium]|nr:hypothetical protein [Kofleriaceae bacterium]